MAKGIPGAEDRAKVKLRVIEFELEGSNASVESSIRQPTQALSNRNGSPAKVVSSSKPAKELGGATTTEEADPLEAEVVDAQETETESSAPATPKAPSKNQSQKHQIICTAS